MNSSRRLVATASTEPLTTTRYDKQNNSAEVSSEGFTTVLCFDEGRFKTSRAGCVAVVINIFGCLFRCTVNRRGAPVGAAPQQTHFTTCSTSATSPTPRYTRKHRYVDAPRHCHSPPLTQTRRPSSPCSEMNEFATVLNHFNHPNGKCLIHSYLSVLPRSSVTSAHSLSPTNTPHRHIHTNTLTIW